MTACKERRLRELLAKAYWRADTPLEFAFVITLYVALGFGNPVFEGSGL